MSHLRRAFYRQLACGLLQKVLVPRLASVKRRQEGLSQWARLFQESQSLLKKDKTVPLMWWHAASVGELENLWPVVVQAASDANTKRVKFVLTVLSESAGAHLEKRTKELQGLGAEVLFSGYAPWEGGWSEALELLQPALFVTSKYEAWPELWMSLAERGIPLAIVGAKARKSLKICARICHALGSPLPRMTLLTADETEISDLQKLFQGQASVLYGGDPRWEQAATRARTGNIRASALGDALKDRLPRPWGVLGSVWLEDLEIWREIFRGGSSIIVVPHRTDPEHLGPMEDLLNSTGIHWIKTSRYGSDQALRGAIAEESAQGGVLGVWVDEMGFLSELYSAADWAYVGGGFGAGVHSRIEPAIHGIPICSGAARSDEFTEAAQLERIGQLTIVRDKGDLQSWLAAVQDKMQEKSAQDRERWARETQERLGASSRIWGELKALIGGAKA